MPIDKKRLTDLLSAERQLFADGHRESARAHREGAEHLFGGVPMTWMNKAAGRFPLYLRGARGSRVTDIDGHEYVDLSLGDTGAMAGHSPPEVVAAIRGRIENEGGITAMMPTENAAWVAAELTRRFGVGQWSFTLTATDANRWAIRLARAVTRRPKVLVYAWCYHGSVDEAFALPGPDGEAVAREGNVGAPVPLSETTRVVEYNDADALENALAHGDVAAVLMEPALTNIGIVLPQPGYLDEVRRLTREHGTLLINDETHTFSAGPGGCTRAWDLEPDMVTIGKAIAGGIPAGAYGLSAELAERVDALSDADLIDTGGVGGTLAGNALSVAAMRATLEKVLTDDAFDGMIARATRFTEGVQDTIDDTGVPWSVVQLGARAEYRFTSPAPTSGSASADASDEDLEDYLHVYLANRGVLLTPFHNMALMSPATTDADVDRHTELFAAAVADLLSPPPC
ncbi:MAG TPA: transaminase [Thermoleophilaceae bacterium]|nr:transaminase [Thermoleophilaceae bacterium]